MSVNILTGSTKIPPSWEEKIQARFPRGHNSCKAVFLDHFNNPGDIKIVLERAASFTGMPEDFSRRFLIGFYGRRASIEDVRSDLQVYFEQNPDLCSC